MFPFAGDFHRDGRRLVGGYFFGTAFLSLLAEFVRPFLGDVRGLGRLAHGERDQLPRCARAIPVPCPFVSHLDVFALGSGPCRPRVLGHELSNPG